MKLIFSPRREQEEKILSTNLGHHPRVGGKNSGYKLIFITKINININLI
ncbi:MAG: hypothetical protein LBR79_02485 [Oscillospiraceae bacterium]|nr:hypothetical protein [Oscillospiraceae bacterium]